MNRQLSEVIKDLERLNDTKSSMPLGLIRDNLENIIDELQKIADSLII